MSTYREQGHIMVGDLSIRQWRQFQYVIRRLEGDELEELLRIGREVLAGARAQAGASASPGIVPKAGISVKARP